ncbi:aldo/keto reductase [Homoserinibacter sp. GY 40078]|uniref:aldo/keto reductase n=1 Tax=Homoserinibacter sp. GY 40078 TaxID=2603275 RepID=UPI002102F9AD|nr:aldo/keto reductase [Homoserinibacter sp. GY 40078]
MTDDEATRTIERATELGYRAFDTASIYRNEAGVGRGLAGSGLPRDDVFVATKLWNDDHPRDRVRPALEASLDRLGLDYLDLFLIHWPAAQGGSRLYLEAWEELLGARRDGLVRSVGVCNFAAEHLAEIDSAELEAPELNQVELHPLHQQRALRTMHLARGIVTQAWAPLARGKALASPVVEAVSLETGRTPAQVVLRWHLQSGFSVIPKSSDPGRLAENMAVFDFALTQEQMDRIDSAETGELTDVALLRFL